MLACLQFCLYGAVVDPADKLSSLLLTPIAQGCYWLLCLLHKHVRLSLLVAGWYTSGLYRHLLFCPGGPIRPSDPTAFRKEAAPSWPCCMLAVAWPWTEPCTLLHCCDALAGWVGDVAIVDQPSVQCCAARIKPVCALSIDVNPPAEHRSSQYQKHDHDVLSSTCNHRVQQTNLSAYDDGVGLINTRDCSHIVQFAFVHRDRLRRHC